MSAIAGIWQYDGQPVDKHQLDTLATVSHEEPSTVAGTVTPSANLALHAQMVAFDHLSATERQPFPFGRGSVVTFYGRLDNRDELLVRLHHWLGPDITDAALVAAAYERWGLDSIPRLIGDWCLAIWDAETSRLVLARDYIGNLPLYYVTRPAGLAWASRLEALGAAFDLVNDPNEVYIAGRLTHGIPPELTLYRGVRALRGGHLLIATRSGDVDVRRYWTFEPSRLRYREVTTYANHLRELLTEGVRVRLRTNRTVWAHLSGGFDSSSNVCLADAMIKRGQVEAPGLQPVSNVASNDPESDESEFITAVERWCGLSSIRREWTDERPTFRELLNRGHPYPPFPERWLEAGMFKTGDRVLLSGQLGDLVMIRGSLHRESLVELLHEGHPLQFLAASFARARQRKNPWIRSMVRLAWNSYQPARLRQWRTSRASLAKRAREAQVSPADLAAVYGITPELLGCAPPPRTSIVYPSVEAFPRAKRVMVSSLYRCMDHGAFSNIDQVPAMWRTFPFSHRPLVEFMIATPQLAFWDPLLNRAGMRRALTDILPPEVLTRKSKGDPTTATERAARQWSPERAAAYVPDYPAKEWQMVKRGYVRRESLERELTTFLAGQKRPTSYLTQCVHMEAWLLSISSQARPSATGTVRDMQGGGGHELTGAWQPARTRL